MRPTTKTGRRRRVTSTRRECRSWRTWTQHRAWGGTRVLTGRWGVPSFKIQVSRFQADGWRGVLLLDTMELPSCGEGLSGSSTSTALRAEYEYEGIPASNLKLKTSNSATARRSLAPPLNSFLPGGARVLTSRWGVPSFKIQVSRPVRLRRVEGCTRTRTRTRHDGASQLRRRLVGIEYEYRPAG